VKTTPLDDCAARATWRFSPWKIEERIHIKACRHFRFRDKALAASSWVAAVAVFTVKI